MSPVASSSVAAAISGSHHGIVLGVGSVQQREQNIIAGMQGAERLKVGEAEILQVSDGDTCSTVHVYVHAGIVLSLLSACCTCA